MAVKTICGVIILSSAPEALAKFYSEFLSLDFTREEHDGLSPHFGSDIGNCHFAIHPPENFAKKNTGPSSTVIAFDVDSLESTVKLLEKNGATCVQPAHDEGFGKVARYTDPEGNPFEIIELSYQFADH
jgi:predicted enzyme related to lactoylglutathione lyase